MHSPFSRRIAFSVLLWICGGTAPLFAQSPGSTVKGFISVNSDTVALVHARLIDGTGNPVKTDQALVIINGKISTVGDYGKVRVPPSAKTIDCTGKTVIPGMIMMHEHLFYGEPLPPNYIGQEMPLSFPRLYLAGGVTTMRTTGAVEPQTDLNIRNWIREGKMTGPDIDVTGPYIERGGLPIPELLFITSPAEAAAEVNFWADRGCTSFKLYMNVTRADAQAAITAAHQRGLKVTGHLCSVTYREAADLGIDNLEHGFWPCSDFDKNKKADQCNSFATFSSLRQLDAESPAMRELMEYLIKKHVAITSTLPVFEPYTGREPFPGGGGEALTPVVRELVEKNYAASLGHDSLAAAMFKKEMKWEKQFADMGGLLMAGIDPTGAGRVIPGYADRHVLELLVEAGFSLPQAVKICTLNAATYLGRNNETGTLEPGKKADLVIINGDLQKDIHAVRNTETVFKNGVGYDSKKLFGSVKEKSGLY